MANNKDFKVKNGIQPTVYHEGLGTVTVSTETLGFEDMYYSGKSLSVGSQETNPYGLFFKPDGLVLFIVGPVADTVFKYNLGTAWDISTASYSGDSFSVSSQETSPRSVFFKSDGTKMYILGTAGDDVNEYSLSTAWDITTASFTTNFSVSAQTTVPIGLFFKSDGTKMYITYNSVWEYNLSTAWDISTASYSQTKDLGIGSVYAVSFKPDGTELYAVSDGDDRIYKHTLSTAWDVSTASYTGQFVYVGDVETVPQDVFFKPDLTEFYLVGNSSDSVFQYSADQITTNTLDLSTGSVFEITPTSDIQIGLSNPAASGTVSAATLLLDGAVNGYDLSGAAYDSVSFYVGGQETFPADIRFNNDGTKMFISGRTGDDVTEYSLSTAYDISTASHVTQFSVTSQETNPTGLAFKPDGTKFYICGLTNDTVYQYSLSTAYDISSGSYDSVSFSVSTEDGSPYSLVFKPDGTKMFVLGATNKKVFQYTLSTAWDVSSASYVSSSGDLSTEDTSPLGMEFNTDGTKVFITGNGSNTVHRYSLSTAYDVSTMSYDSVSFSVSSQETGTAGVTFNSDGTKMFITGFNTDYVYQYTTGSAYTVTYDTSLQWGGGTAPDSPAANETDVLTFTTRDGGTTYQAAIAIDGAA